MRPKVRFPSLRDESWVHDRLAPEADDLGAEAIASELGCSIQSARQALLRFGYYRHRPWTGIEKIAVHVFYAEFQAQLIAKALGRTNWSVWQFAARNSIRSKARVPRAPSDEESNRFWQLWRNFIRDHFRDKAHDRRTILRLTWKPATREESCEGCPDIESCRAGLDILPCEKLTVRDVIVQEGVRTMAYRGQGRLSRDKWSVICESPGSQHYYAERFVDGKLEQEWIKGHCMACAKTNVLMAHGGQVDLRGWHMAPSPCGAILVATQRTIDEENKLKTCLHCGSLVARAALLDSQGRTVEEGGEIEECVMCPHCDHVFLAEEEFETGTANVEGEENP